jgi:GNAT superfamily N-acetyltransferase
MIRTFVKAAAGNLVTDYWNVWLYTLATSASARPEDDGEVSFHPIDDVAEIRGSGYPEIQRQAWVRETDTWVFGARVGGELAAVCWLQARATYRQRRGLFKLREDEAELAQITTAEIFRGRGIATRLIQFAASEMEPVGIRKLYAKIWRDNLASKAAFEGAGWRLERRFVSCRLRKSATPFIVSLPRPRGNGARSSSVAAAATKVHSRL